MSFRIVFPAKIYCMAFLALVCCVVSTSCRHTVPAVRVEATELEPYTGNREAYVLAYDPAAKSFSVTRKEWRQTREKVETKVVRMMRLRSECFAFSDGWMKHSLWNGKRKKNMEWMMIPPFTLYPVVDTVILSGCFLGDCVLYPYRRYREKTRYSVVKLSTPEQVNPDRVVLAELRFDKNLSYQDVSTRRRTRSMNNHIFSVTDMGQVRRCFTDRAGKVPVARVIPYLLPVRGVNIHLTELSGAFGGRVYISTERFLTAEQKELHAKLQRMDVPVSEKKEILKKLERIYEPAALLRVKRLLGI